MKQIKVEIPKSLNDLPLGKFQELSKIMTRFKERDADIEDMVDIVACYTGIEKKEVLNSAGKTIIDIAGALIKLISSYERKKPPRNLTILGVKYEMAGGRKEWSGGQYVDVKTNVGDIEDNWGIVAALMYVPEGEDYNDSIMSDRANLFHEHFPTQVYLDVSAFFLPNSKSWKHIILERLKKGLSLKRILNLNRGIRT